MQKTGRPNQYESHLKGHSPAERKQSEKVLRFVQNSHLILVTIVVITDRLWFVANNLKNQVGTESAHFETTSSVCRVTSCSLSGSAPLKCRRCSCRRRRSEP